MKIDPADFDELVQFDMQRDVDAAKVEQASDADSIGEVAIAAAQEFRRAARSTLATHGSQRGWDYEPVADSITVRRPNYEGQRRGFGFGQMVVPIDITHPAAQYWDSGMDPTLITPTDAQALKIPWPDLPPGVEAQGEEGGVPFVLRPKAEVAGYDRIPFVDEGELAAKRTVEQFG
jgi:hypothetical protein